MGDDVETELVGEPAAVAGEAGTERETGEGEPLHADSSPKSARPSPQIASPVGVSTEGPQVLSSET